MLHSEVLPYALELVAGVAVRRAVPPLGLDQPQRLGQHGRRPHVARQRVRRQAEVLLLQRLRGPRAARVAQQHRRLLLAAGARKALLPEAPARKFLRGAERRLRRRRRGSAAAEGRPVLLRQLGRGPAGGDVLELRRVQEERGRWSRRGNDVAAVAWEGET
jgi:hypothetical protein